jgi:hypothetical protein
MTETGLAKTPNKQKPALTKANQTDLKTCLPNENDNLPKPRTNANKPILKTYKTNRDHSRRKRTCAKLT